MAQYETKTLRLHTVVTTPLRWFMRGMLTGLLLMASLNALSFFVRTGGWGSLLGRRSVGESMGFPIEFWRQQPARFYEIDNLAIFWNALIGIAFGTLLGVITVSQQRWLNRMIDDIETHAEENQSGRFQFSLRGLMLATFIAALIAMIAKTLAARPEVLASIYLFGPLLLVLIAMLPRGISWQYRVAIIAPAAIMLILVAVGIGIALGMEFDKVLMGIFVCWVPQSALAAFALTLGILAIYYRRFAGNMESEAASP